jgi:hypothetical protein
LRPVWTDYDEGPRSDPSALFFESRIQLTAFTADFRLSNLYYVGLPWTCIPLLNLERRLRRQLTQVKAFEQGFNFGQL